MNGNLVDTNIIIKLLNGDQDTIHLFETLEEIYISVITAGELYYGANKSSRIEENLSLFQSFLSEYTLIDIDEDISRKYGQIKANLIARGINIPENDIWIAATAYCRNLEIISYDEHFELLNGKSEL